MWFQINEYKKIEDYEEFWSLRKGEKVIYFVDDLSCHEQERPVDLMDNAYAAAKHGNCVLVQRRYKDFAGDRIAYFAIGTGKIFKPDYVHILDKHRKEYRNEKN